jgi:hypothetical protein
MRAAVFSVLTLSFAAIACAQLNQGGSSGGAAGDGGAGSDAEIDAGIQGAGCGTERQTGITLCTATTKCPNVVVDVQQFPSCGFRIRGATVDLVCGCTDSVCPMGIFTTCEQAQKLLASQSEGTVCSQVSEDRCEAKPSSSSSSSTSSTTSSGGSSNGGIGCDKQCLTDCGGGSACASLCNCD